MPSHGIPRVSTRPKLSHLNLLLWNHWTKLIQTWLGCSSFNIVTGIPTLHSRWWLLLNIEISLIFYCCFIIGKKWTHIFHYSYMAMHSLTYHFFQPIYTDYRMHILREKKNHIKICSTEIWADHEMTFGWSNIKIICETQTPIQDDWHYFK